MTASGHGHGHGHQPGAASGLGSWIRSLVTPHSHDPADSVDHALESSTQGLHAVRVSLLVLLVTAGGQAALVAMTGSVALLADTIHNFSDALTAVPLWVAFVIGRRPPDSRYTYGYGRAEDLAGVFIVLMIAASAIVAGVESVRRLVDPQPIQHAGVVMLAGGIGFLGNELVAEYRIRVGRRIGSAALVADGLHARTDGLTSLAVVAGAAAVMAGVSAADPVVGLIITFAILLVLRSAARDIYRRLMDAVDPDLVKRAEASLAGVPGVLEVEEVRLRWVGHRMHAEAGVVVDASSSVVDGHQVAVESQHALLHAIPKLARATVHVSPAGPDGAAQHATLDHHLDPGV